MMEVISFFCQTLVFVQRLKGFQSDVVGLEPACEAISQMGEDHRVHIHFGCLGGHRFSDKSEVRLNFTLNLSLLICFM